MSTSEAGLRLHGFPGGLKMRHHKQVSCQQPPAVAEIPERLYIPIGQHQGEVGTLQVEPGARVLRGQVLTASEDDFVVPAHASTSGNVADVVEWPASWPPGSSRRCIELISDGRDESIEPQPLSDWQCRDSEEIIDHLRTMGLAGLGGAMFPTAAKLRGDWGGLDTLILNGAECEPWISCDEMLMRTRPEAIIKGARILARAISAGRVLIAIEDPMDEVGAALECARRELDPDNKIQIVRIPAVYPEGGERQLIQTLTGLEVPHDGLPQDLGLVCHSVATAAAAFDAVARGLPLTERLVTVTGPGILQPRNFSARIGTRIANLVAQAGGYTDRATRLVLGGPMSGIALPTDDIPITKGSNCILALKADQVSRSHPTLPCINCTECVRVCPASLLPQLLFKAVAADQDDEAAELNLFDCIECGCCAQVCPSHIPLVDWYRHGKDRLHMKRLDQRRAALAKRRFEARQARLEKAQAERQARRERRRQKLAAPDQAKSEIQAAIERARGKKD
jgi:Na+-translocating ferredoxin:NAD+ oxidoreductase subunit C